MQTGFSAELGLCGRYEELLDMCEHALSAWSARSEQVRQRHLSGVAIGSDLLRLQARFAKAYANLRGHVDTCGQCRRRARVNHSRVFRSNAA